MDKKREPTRQLVWQALLSDCRVIFTRVSKIEAMYTRPRVSVKVERGSTFTFTRGLSYIASISFMHVNSGKITRQCKSTLTQPSKKKDAVEHETRETSTVRENDERKSNVLSCFYTFFLILSYLFCFQLGFHAGVWCFNPRSRPSSLQVFFFFFSTKARPRGTLIAATIIKASGKLRINFSLGSFS